jgi:hypothetical protein
LNDETQNAEGSDEKPFSLDQLEAIECIRRGLLAVKQGRTKPAAEVFAEIRKKHNIPPLRESQDLS